MHRLQHLCETIVPMMPYTSILNVKRKLITPNVSAAGSVWPSGQHDAAVVATGTPPSNLNYKIGRIYEGPC